MIFKPYKINYYKPNRKWNISEGKKEKVIKMK